MENRDGMFLTHLLAGDALYFPEVSNINENAVIQFMASAADKSVITIHEDSADGPVLGQCEIGTEKKLYEDKLICEAGKKSLYLVADKATELHWFSFPSDKKRCTIEPVFSIVGRGASIDFDQNAANHQVLRNMELRGAFIKALADGGKGGAGKLTVPYYCTEKDVQLSVYVNQEFQGILDFPVTASSQIKKTPDISQIDVTLQPGLNQVLLYCRGEEGCSAYQLLVNDNDCGILYFNFTDAYSVKAMETYDVKIELRAAFNTLTLRKAGQTDKGIFVDAFAITPLNWEKDEE